MAPIYTLERNEKLPGIDKPTTVNPEQRYSGFYPFGTEQIRVQPWVNTFRWTTTHRRVWVDDESKLPSKIAPAKELSLKVITYKGISLIDQKFSDELFVYIGESNYVRESHQHVYMRLVDLVVRLHDNCHHRYTEDLKAYNANELPFYAWDHETNDIPTSNYKNEKGWKDYYLELLKLNGEDSSHERLFIKFSAFASAATYPPKEPYSTLARFFDQEVDGIHMFFRVDPVFNNVFKANDNFSSFKEIIEKVKRDTQKRNKSSFIPATYDIVSFASTNEEWKNHKRCIGGHPQNLYDVWVHRNQINALKVHGMWDDCYQLIDPKSLAGALIKNQTAKTPFDTETTTIVANKAWKRSDPNSAKVIDDAEWLHRSAFSYGGLGEKRSALSSQDAENLILGTKATNTAMLRVEEFIKRYTLREGAEVEVKTQPLDQEGIQEGVLGDNKVWYLAPTLKYTYKSRKLDMNKETRHVQLKDSTIWFHTLNRYTPLRFEFEVGRLAEAAYFGWNNEVIEDEYETKEESDANSKAQNSQA